MAAIRHRARRSACTAVPATAVPPAPTTREAAAISRIASTAATAASHLPFEDLGKATEASRRGRGEAWDTPRRDRRLITAEMMGDWAGGQGRMNAAASPRTGASSTTTNRMGLGTELAALLGPTAKVNHLAASAGGWVTAPPTTHRASLAIAAKAAGRQSGLTANRAAAWTALGPGAGPATNMTSMEE
jgi:hypothetical protein